MPKIKVDVEFAQKRLDVFLSESLNISRKVAQEIIEKGVLINGKNVDKSSFKLKGQELVEYFEIQDKKRDTILQAQEIKLDIKYEDEHLLVINKPKNMLTHPTAFEDENTLVNALLYHCGDNLSNKNEPLRRGIVHRLDKNTAGLMLVAKTDLAHNSLQEQIRQKTAKRKYLAIALGEFCEDEGKIDKPLVHYLGKTVKMNIAQEGEGKPALTYYKVIERFFGATLLELELKTGRTHQIRAHLASINHPIFGDSLYGANGMCPQKYRRIKTNEQVLQSYYLSFTHPIENEIMAFELALEDFDSDFIKVLKIMRENI